MQGKFNQSAYFFITQLMVQKELKNTSSREFFPWIVYILNGRFLWDFDGIHLRSVVFPFFAVEVNCLNVYV